MCVCVCVLYHRSKLVGQPKTFLQWNIALAILYLYIAKLNVFDNFVSYHLVMSKTADTWKKLPKF